MSTDVAKASAATPESGASAEDSTLSADAASPGGSTPTAPEGKKKKNRCQMCKKKVGLTGMMRRFPY